MLVLAVVCYPISRILDVILGEHEITRYKNDQLKALVTLHSKKALDEINYMQEHTPDMGLTNIQSKIISGAFDMDATKVHSITT